MIKKSSLSNKYTSVILNRFFTYFLEKSLNQVLRLDPLSLAALGKLSGKIITIELRGIDLHFSLFPDAQGIVILANYQGNTDVSVSSAPFTLLPLFFQQKSSLIHHPDITITGDIGILQQLSTIFKAMEIDWEAHWAKWIGGIPSHYLNQIWQQGQSYSYERLQTLQLNCTEYLQEEARHLPAPLEIEYFLSQIDTLRNDVERLTIRLQRLEKRVN